MLGLWVRVKVMVRCRVMIQSGIHLSQCQQQTIILPNSLLSTFFSVKHLNTISFAYSVQCNTTEIIAKQKDPKYSFTFDATKYPLTVTIACAAGHEFISRSPAKITCLTTGIWDIVGPNNPDGDIGECVSKYFMGCIYMLLMF